MDIGELIKTQIRLTQAQVQISNLMKEIIDKNPNLRDVESEVKRKVIDDILKITIKEYPPKIDVFRRIEVINGSVIDNAYQEVRDRWYSLIRKAMKGYEGGRIDPAIVYLVYYVPWMCDVSNFTGKMIIDGLMYYGAIATDDNLENVPIEIQEARIDKENPRTEVYIIPYHNQVEKILLPYKEDEKLKKEIAEYEKKIENLENEIGRLREAKQKEGIEIISKKNDETAF
jgi:hypothetical protein